MGKLVYRDGFHDTFKAYLKKSGLKNIRFHDLRNTHATLLLIQGVHPKIVSERLGHKDIFITLNRYSHVLPECKRMLLKHLVRDYSDSNVCKMFANTKNAVSLFTRNRITSIILLNFKLTCIQIKVESFLFHKRFMISSFKNTTIFNYKYLICFFNRFQPMSDYKTCSPSH